jgi:serine-threonine kinase receptor-associated protein
LTSLGHKGAVWSAKIDQRSRSLCATASGDFTAKLWCVSTGKELYELKHKHIVRSVDFSSSAEKIVTGCNDGLLRIFDTCRLDSQPLELSSTSSKEPIMKVSWLDEANTVILGRRSGQMEVYDMRSGTISHSIDAPGGSSIMDLEINREYGHVLVATGKTVLFLSLSDLQIIKSFSMPESMHFREEGGASLHPLGNRFMAGASDLWLREFDSTTGEVISTMKGHHGPIRCVRYHPNGKVVASGSEDGTIRLWENETFTNQS